MPNRKLILLAEPEEAIRESIEMILIDEGYDCHAVADPRALLRAIKIHQSDLIITDIQMIYSNIEEVLAALQHYPKVPPIIVTLTYERIGDLLKLMKYDVNEYILKPFIFEDMVDRISHMLDDKSVSKD